MTREEAVEILKGNIEDLANGNWLSPSRKRSMTKAVDSLFKASSQALPTGKEIASHISMKTDLKQFKKYCGSHADFVVEQKFEEFCRSFPPVNYVLGEAIDFAIEQLTNKNQEA